MNKKILIAMSGGVDSSVAAFIIKQEGHDTTGMTMKLFDNDGVSICHEKSCCSLEDIEDARSVARRLGIPYYVYNFKDRFKENVIDRFVGAYTSGSTPNPCIDCNRYIKFEELMRRAMVLNFDYVVTGHYAVIEKDEQSGRYFLKKAVDETKDQSYFLYSLTQEQLSKTLFPLGKLRKSEVRIIAEENGFINANKQDSQDICFVPDGDYAGFIEKYTKQTYAEGKFVRRDGTVLGTHKGIIRYTIGQRKGLGISSPEPLYICDILPEENIIVLGTEEELYENILIAEQINLIDCDRIDVPRRVKAKIRYRQKEQNATITQIGEDRIQVEFDQPQKAITKGQSVVFYDNDYVVGGGIIS